MSGSVGKHSTDHRILQFLSNRFSHILKFEIFDGIDKLPHFSTQLDNEHLPLEVLHFRTQIEKADGILICTPEYIFSLPGSLKNALEWNVSTRLFETKSVAMIVASASGEKNFDSLALILETLGANVPMGSRLLIQGAKGKINEDFTITDIKLLHEIDSLMASFSRTVY
nr:NADPH-dependent FMN reductase [Gelidibacter algens]